MKIMNLNTTLAGIVTILTAITAAIVGYLQTGTVDPLVLLVGISAGCGLIFAKDAAPPTAAP
jgi:hypothetical protein